MNKPLNNQTKSRQAPTRRRILSPQRPARELIVPALRFTPTAWAKLGFLCHLGDTEIGGFGICAPDDLLRIEHFETVRQTASSASVEFDDNAVAAFFEDQVDVGRRPEQFARVWCHTHPGDCPRPSCVDEWTFERVFGRCDWAVMLILARGGDTYARLRFNVGPRGDLLIPVEIDYSRPFDGTDEAAWRAEYEANVQPIALRHPLSSLDADWGTWPDELSDEGVPSHGDLEFTTAEDDDEPAEWRFAELV